MPIYMIDIEFGWKTLEIKTKNQRDAIEEADIPVGAIFTIRKKKGRLVGK